MRRTRSVLEHFAQTVGLDVLLVLGIVLMVAFKVWPSTRGIAVNFCRTRDFIERRPRSSDHLDHLPRFDQQHPTSLPSRRRIPQQRIRRIFTTVVPCDKDGVSSDSRRQ